MLQSIGFLGNIQVSEFLSQHSCCYNMCIILTANFQACIHPHASVQKKSWWTVFIASCQTKHLRHTEISISACVILHNSEKHPHAQICAAWTWGFFSLMFQSAFELQHLSQTLQSLSHVSLHFWILHNNNWLHLSE